MNKIRMIMPTRGRPERAAEMSASFYDNAYGRGWPDDPELWLALDRNDSRISEYDYKHYWLVLIGNMVERTNKMAKYLLDGMDDRDILGWMADDSRIKTYGWDKFVTNAFDKGALMVQTNDLHMGEERAQANFFMRADVVKALGWFALPTSKHLYVDSAWTTLGKASGTLKYLPDVIIEHAHPVVDKGVWDQQYLDTHVEIRYAEDRAAFESWQHNNLPEDVVKVRSCLNS